MGAHSEKPRASDRDGLCSAAQSVAVVTGAANGIGATVVNRLRAAGYQVLALDNQFPTEINGYNAGDFCALNVIEVKCDVTNNEQVEAIFTTLAANLKSTAKRIELLVSCAGVARDAPLLGVGPETQPGDRLLFDKSAVITDGWHLMLNTNLLGSAIIAHHYVRAVQECTLTGTLEGTTGNMIFISSMIAELYHSMGFWIYRASKTGLQVVVEGIRQELRQAGSRIRVTSILPCPVKNTQLFAHEGAHHQAKYFSGFTCLSTDDVADAIEHVMNAPAEVEMTQIQLNTCDLPVDVRYVQRK